MNYWVYRLYNKIWRMSSLYESAPLSPRSASSGQRTDPIQRSAGGSQIAHGKHQLFWLLHRSGCPASRRGPHDDLSSVWLQNGPARSALRLSGSDWRNGATYGLSDTKEKLITIRRGERGWAGRCGPSRSPASCSPGTHLGGRRSPPPPTGDHKGPPNLSSTTLAPTDRPASCLTSRFRLMRMRADQSAVCAINRHLQWVEDPHRG